jgi:hypothetical protein
LFRSSVPALPCSPKSPTRAKGIASRGSHRTSCACMAVASSCTCCKPAAHQDVRVL